MSGKRIPSFWVAVLGVAIGVLATLLAVRISERSHNLRAGYSNWRKLNLVLQTAEQNYVDSIDFDKVTDAAALAALQALDPHSIYMPPEDLQASEDDLASNFEGIGIQFNVPNDTAVVLEVIPGGPSEKIGLRQGDRLLKVNETVIAGVKFPQDSMVRRMKGPSGTKVTVTVLRGSETIPFEITRGKIPIHCVDASFMLNDTTGYLRLSKFSRTTTTEVASSVSALQEAGMKRLLFDVRGNSGGYFDQALSLANLFLEKGKMIVYMEGNHRAREEYKADGRGLFKDIPLALLIDDGSASSSEIFAGAMQDNGRAKLYGRRSFGKGLVQEPFNFNDGSGFRLTVARFHTPSGRCIQKPYSDDYQYEIYKRYDTGEMVSADSMKLENGGIIPDVFVPVDTTRASAFYVSSNRKAVPMRFAASFFDRHRDELSSIDSYPRLLKYLDNAGLEKGFLAFAKSVDGLVPSEKEWADNRQYIMPQVRALVGRYSKLGDNAFYHLYLDIDDTVKAALTAGR